MLEELYPRRDLLIPTLLDSYIIDKKLTFKQMMAELYHPSTLIVDWWLGRYGHPKEMFNMFANFFVEDTYNTGKKVISYLKPGTQFLLAQHMVREDEEDIDACYIVGHTSSKMPRFFCKNEQNTFTPVCVLYKEDVIHNSQQITQKQHIRH